MKRKWARQALTIGLALLVFVLVAATTCVALGIGLLFLLNQLYEGRGHPPLPGAPDWVYVGGFFIAIPLLSLGLAAFFARKIVILRRTAGSPGP